jgi:hypothetical protein
MSQKLWFCRNPTCNVFRFAGDYTRFEVVVLMKMLYIVVSGLCCHKCNKEDRQDFLRTPGNQQSSWSALRIFWRCTRACNAWNYCVFGLRPSSGILKEHNISETWFVSILMWQGGRRMPTLLGLLEKANLSHWSSGWMNSPGGSSTTSPPRRWNVWPAEEILSVGNWGLGSRWDQWRRLRYLCRWMTKGVWDIPLSAAKNKMILSVPNWFLSPRG